MPYVVLSDPHCHKWSLYSTTLASGVNSRLQLILDEMNRAAETLLAAGGSTLVIAGDIFHVRGSIDPEVLNPAQDVIRGIMDQGISIEMIPGNHDLAGKETTALGSSIQTLSETFSAEGSIRVFNTPSLLGKTAISAGRAFLPWCPDNQRLINQAEELAAEAAKSNLKDYDLFIHAGIDGVLPGMPDHGLTAARLQALGFRNVFAGHYHNHKDLGGGVYSIGATTHQTWGDVNTRAGFLLVNDDGTVQHYDSNAPKFVDISGLSETDMEIDAIGNYARFRGAAMKTEDVKELREWLLSVGAKGVSIEVAKAAVSARASAPSSSGKSLDQSVLDFIDEDKDLAAHIDRAVVKREAAAVLATSRAIYEEA